MVSVSVSAAGCSGSSGTFSSGSTEGFGGGGAAAGGIGGFAGSGGVTGGNGGGSGCSSCTPSCGNGLVSTEVSSCDGGICSDCRPCVTQFCPGPCSPDGTTCLGFTVVDGGVGSCLASRLLLSQGLLLASVKDDGGVAVEQGSTVLLATSSELACESTVDAGIQPPSGPAAILSIDFSTGTPGFEQALLTSWDDGGLTRISASSGSIEVFDYQPGVGVMGNYALTFGTDTEQGTFIAPACSVCVTPP